MQGGTGTDNLVLMGTGTEAISKFLSFETLSMTGTDWTLTGTGAFTTSTTVGGGFLHVNGQLTSPTVTINGGTLGGTGTIVGAVTNNAQHRARQFDRHAEHHRQLHAGDRFDLHGRGQYDDLRPHQHHRHRDHPGRYHGQPCRRRPASIRSGTSTPFSPPRAASRGTYTTLTDNAAFVDFSLTYDPTNVYLNVISAGVPFHLRRADAEPDGLAAGALQVLGSGPAFNAVAAAQRNRCAARLRLVVRRDPRLADRLAARRQPACARLGVRPAAPGGWRHRGAVCAADFDHCLSAAMRRPMRKMKSQTGRRPWRVRSSARSRRRRPPGRR